MLWKVIPDDKHTDYDMYDGAIIKADTKEEAERIATKEFNHMSWYWKEDTKQIWTATPLIIDELENGIVFESYRAG